MGHVPVGLSLSWLPYFHVPFDTLFFFPYNEQSSSSSTWPLSRLTSCCESLCGGIAHIKLHHLPTVCHRNCHGFLRSIPAYIARRRTVGDRIHVPGASEIVIRIFPCVPRTASWPNRRLNRLLSSCNCLALVPLHAVIYRIDISRLQTTSRTSG